MGSHFDPVEELGRHCESDELLDYLEGLLDQSREHLVERHLAGCESCVAVLGTVSRASVLVEKWTVQGYAELQASVADSGTPAVADARTKRQAAPLRRLWDFVTSPFRERPLFAVAGVALAAIATIAVITFSSNRTSPPEMTKGGQRELPAPHPPQAPEIARNPQTPSPVPQESQPKRPEPRPRRDPLSTAAQSVLSFLLVPTARGEGDGNRFMVPPGQQRIAFRIETEDAHYPEYQAILEQLEAQTKLTIGGLQATLIGPDRWGITVPVPVRAVRAGSYILTLVGSKADGSSEVVGAYGFEIVIR